MKKIAILGVFGRGEEFTTGQAVKCNEIAQWLYGKYGGELVVKVNSFEWKKRPIRLIVALTRAYMNCKNIIVLPAQHGIKVFAPLLYYYNKIANRSIHYVVIGGWLGTFLEENSRYKKYIQSFSSTCVELKSMQEKLKCIGVQNAMYLPNFRKYNGCGAKAFRWKKHISVCTYSRVTEDKGILSAIEICKRANRMLGGLVVHLNIYGKIAEDFRDKFYFAVECNKEQVTYCGVKQSEESTQILQEHFALLFPTTYPGEGFAGTILDSFAAGIPVIASNWKYNPEIIEDGVNGLLYDYLDLESAAKKLVLLYSSPKLYMKIQQGCHVSAQQFDTDYVLEPFGERLL